MFINCNKHWQFLSLQGQGLIANIFFADTIENKDCRNKKEKEKGKYFMCIRSLGDASYLSLRGFL